MVSRQQLAAFQVRNAPGFGFLVDAKALCPTCGRLRPYELLLGMGRARRLHEPERWGS